MKSNTKSLWKKLCFKIIAIITMLLVVLLIVVVIIHSAEKDYAISNDKLIEDYYGSLNSTTSTTEGSSNYDLYNNESTTQSSTSEVYEGTTYGVDSILRVKDLGIEMPVCKGNFNADIEAYRLSVYNVNMQIGKTTYTVMGHHAISLDIAFGWLDQLEVGTYIQIEHAGVIYEYVVTDITVHKASELTYLFTLAEEDVVYLATCDYSLGLSDNIVYRAVKCERR